MRVELGELEIPLPQEVEQGRHGFVAFPHGELDPIGVVTEITPGSVE